VKKMLPSERHTTSLGLLDIIRNNDIMESAKPKQNQGLLAGDITCALLSSSQG
jgi:hypothetical protein